MISVPAAAEHSATVRKFVLRNGNGLDPHLLDDLLLGVSEAFANAVLHAGGSDPVHVEFRQTHADVEICLRYAGRPFAGANEPPALPDPERLAENGLGRYLLFTLFDNVRYDFSRGTTTLTLCRSLSRRG